MAERNDIGFAVEAQNLTDEDRIKYLNPWTPNNNDEFPQSHHVKGTFNYWKPRKLWKPLETPGNPLKMRMMVNTMETP